MPGLSDTTVGAASQPLMRFVSNAEIDASSQAAPTQQVISGLSAHLEKLWQRARDAKNNVGSNGKSIQDMLLAALRQRNGEYDPDKLKEIREAGPSEVFMLLTAVKCRAAEAWIRDVMLPANEAAWEIRPTPKPDIPPFAKAKIAEQVQMVAMQALQAGQPVPAGDIRQLAERLEQQLKQQVDEYAKRAAERMGEAIRDVTEEGGWREAFEAVVSDVVTFKAGIIKGPIKRRRKKLSWVTDQFGNTTAQVEMVTRIEFERRSPFDIYPSPGAVSIQDGYLFDRLRGMSRADLNALIGVDGYSDEAIRKVLTELPNGWKVQQPLDSERAQQENKPTDTWAQGEDYEGLEFWGSVPGKLLKEWGADVDDETADYSINAIKIGNHVIKAMINPDPLGLRPYGKACYEEIPGSFWGRGVPELMADVQDICNATARAIVNNMAISSGPQVAIEDITRVPAGETLTDMYPWKLWQFKGSVNSNNTRPPITFFQPDSLASELMKVFEYFSRLADDYTGVPAYTYGDASVSGAGKTASGLSMLLGQASRGMKQVISNIDRGIIEPPIRAVYYDLMMSDDNAIKGDCYVVARGSMSLIQKEQQQLRRLEFLNLTNNPVDMQIIGIKGRAKLLRGVAKSMDLDPDEMIPDDEELDAIEARQQEMASAQMQHAMQLEMDKRERDDAAKQAKIALDKRAQDIDLHKITLEDQRERAKMGLDAARLMHQSQAARPAQQAARGYDYGMA